MIYNTEGLFPEGLNEIGNDKQLFDLFMETNIRYFIIRKDSIKNISNLFIKASTEFTNHPDSSYRKKWTYLYLLLLKHSAENIKLGGETLKKTINSFDFVFWDRGIEDDLLFLLQLNIALVLIPNGGGIFYDANLIDEIYPESQFLLFGKDTTGLHNLKKNKKQFMSEFESFHFSDIFWSSFEKSYGKTFTNKWLRKIPNAKLLYMFVLNSAFFNYSKGKEAYKQNLEVYLNDHNQVAEIAKKTYPLIWAKQ